MTTSLYIHWPFCESKCPYCDFNSHVSESIEHDSWRCAYLSELKHYAPAQKTKIGSIFFGGGTPSLMHPETVAAIIEKAKEQFDIADDIEITLEANPSSFEVEKFKAFKQAGINRVSIGVQSFNEAALKFLGRRHDKKQAINAIEQAGKIFGNFSFDLIYALPNQTTENWKNELDFALSFNTPHLSLYQLTIEKGTPFYSDYHKGKFKLPEEELQTDLYLTTVEKCAKKDLHRYEISNFAKTGFESQHNLGYWRQDDYIGIGPGAHGRIHQNNKKIATTTIHHPQNWLKAVEEKGHGIQSNEELSQKEILEELIFMGLRIREGIKLDKLEDIYSRHCEETSPTKQSRPYGSPRLQEQARDDAIIYKTFDQKLIQKLCDEGLMEITSERIRLTDSGLLMHTGIVKKLFSN